MRNHCSRTPIGRSTLPVLPFLVLGTVAIFSGGCASFLQSMDPRTRATTNLDPLEAERRGEQVFGAYGIPVAERVANYRVQSGRFIASEIWGVVPIERRIHCGWDEDGLPRARGRDVELEVTLRLSGRGSYTSIRLESSGRILTDANEAEGAKCQLAPEFAETLVWEVAGRPSVGSRFPAVAGHGMPWNAVDPALSVPRAGR